MSSDVDSSDEPVYVFVDPFLEMNLGLWFLFGGATIFLAARLYFKSTRRHQLWWDDYILLLSWVRSETPARENPSAHPQL